jgi:sugar/nucleoside kinase (ribokinase family)
VVVGAASRDLDPHDPRGWRLGGGVTYSAMALARLGVPVGAVIGLDEQASSARELDDLRAAGVELAPVRVRNGPVVHNQETPTGRVQVSHSASDRVPVAALPAAWAAAPAALLNPVAGELDWRWARAFADNTLVALGWQGLLRRLRPGQPVEALPVRPMALIARADIATLSTEDAAGGARVALDRLLPRPGQQLVVTSDRGFSLHLRRESDGWAIRTVSVNPSARRVDPTGAGDVFLASWLAGVLALRAAEPNADDWRALALAATAAGAKVEVGSLAEIEDLRALCARLKQLG